MGIRIGIDIGTSNSSIAIYDGETAEALAVNEGVISVYGGEKRLSSAVYLQEDNKNLILGQAAYNMRMRHPERFASEFKRAFGSEVPIVLGDKPYPVDEIYTVFFRKLLSFAEKIGKIDEVYITHPADYSKDMIDRLKKAAKLAGLYNVTTVDEPSAAAISYTANHKLADGSIVLVYDFGGGTFDAALIQKTKDGFRHLTKSEGLNDCGGTDFDRAIFEEIVSRIQREYGSDSEKLFGNAKFIASLTEQAVKIKHQLSLSESYTESIPVGFDWFECTFKRAEFDQMIAPSVKRTSDLLEKLIRRAGIQKSAITKVLLVGGTCNIPYVRENIANMFGKGKIVELPNPELAVCFGAVQYKCEEERRIREEQVRKEEEKKKEEQRKREEKARLEEQKRQEEKRKAEQRIREEKKRQEEEAKKEEQRKKEEKARQEEQRKREEEIRKEERRKIQEEARKKEQKRLEEERIREEKKKRAKEERKNAHKDSNKFYNRMYLILWILMAAGTVFAWLIEDLHLPAMIVMIVIEGVLMFLAASFSKWFANGIDDLFYK